VAIQSTFLFSVLCLFHTFCSTLLGKATLKRRFTISRVPFTTALGTLFLAAAPLQLKGAFLQSPAAEPLTAKEVRKAEASARTVADHLRLALYYEAKARETESKLMDAQDLVNYWGQKSWMVNRTKVPNPYSSAKSLADSYRAEFERETKLAAGHRRMVEMLQAGVQ
jgi:hypothetical protein